MLLPGDNSSLSPLMRGRVKLLFVTAAILFAAVVFWLSRSGLSPALSIACNGFYEMGGKTYVSLLVTNQSEKPAFLLLTGVESKTNGRWISDERTYQACSHNLGRHTAMQWTKVEAPMASVAPPWRLKVCAYQPATASQKLKAALVRLLQRATGRQNWLQFWDPSLYAPGREFYTPEFDCTLAAN
jgi:hypothetical protein